MSNNDMSCAVTLAEVSVSITGGVKPCCMAKGSYKADNNFFETYKTSLLSMWFSESRRKWIEDMRNGIKVPACRSCWVEEENNIRSVRSSLNEQYSSYDLKFEDLPKKIDLHIGNTCNLKCRSCNASQSSAYLQEDAQLNSPSDITGYIKNYYKKSPGISKNFNFDNDYLWEDIFKILHSVETIQFQGGEPFFTPKHRSIIDYCIEHDLAKNIELFYSTNGTIFPEEYIESLKQFKNVTISFSIDGVGKRFEYLRHPACWTDVVDNIQKFIAVNKFKFRITLTMTVFNIYYIHEVVDFVQRHFNFNVQINIARASYNPSLLNIEVKNKVIDHLLNQSCFDNKRWHVVRDALIKYLKGTMNDSNFEEWTKIYNDTMRRDKFRKENFEETFPEYYEILKDHIPQKELIYG